MDYWIYVLAVAYVAVSTPFASIGFATVYLLTSAYFSAKKDQEE